ncbi:MAG: hypothetical protein P857_583 [Candidatus Xenolissoclinum pacificiensis L6]|uniref:Uncharacterized protein n=1 Tax=Candidatus Xenolissoclinum pacificiensis L6 TaxID=1401685 RepID=W2V0B8_9RICK|nr:MAG: hypothetical protein P857_583 [Candidatus Xenolissoclinum pacificiensis L6]
MYSFTAPVGGTELVPVYDIFWHLYVIGTAKVISCRLASIAVALLPVTLIAPSGERPNERFKLLPSVPYSVNVSSSFVKEITLFATLFVTSTATPTALKPPLIASTVIKFASETLKESLVFAITHSLSADQRDKT